MIFNPSSGGGSWCDFTPGDFTRSRSAKRRPKPLLSKSFLPQAACDLFQTLDWKLGIWSKHVKTNPPKKVSLVTNPPQTASIDAVSSWKSLRICPHQSENIDDHPPLLWWWDAFGFPLSSFFFSSSKMASSTSKNSQWKLLKKQGLVKSHHFLGGTSSCRYGRMASSCCGKVDKHQPGLLGKRYHKATT